MSTCLLFLEVGLRATIVENRIEDEKTHDIREFRLQDQLLGGGRESKG